MTHDGADAAQAGLINHNQDSWLQVVVPGPGTVAFWWKVSSEMDYDYLEFSIDGLVQTRISGEEEWHQLSFEVPSGNRTLRWRFFKDSATTLGQDLAWVDRVAFLPHVGALAIVAHPGNQTAGLHDTATFAVGAAGEPPLSYQWFYNETNPVSTATAALLTLPDVDLADAGRYSVVISNGSGAVTSSVATLTVTTNGTVETILLFADVATAGPYETALGNLGRSFQRITSDETFHLAATQADESRTLVVVDPVLGNHTFSAVAHFANRGGRVLLQYWGMDVGSPFAQAFDAEVVQMLTDSAPVHDWGGSPFFGGVANPISFQDLYIFAGQKLEPRAGGLPVGGHAAMATSNEAALIIGNFGRTILNGFVAETASPSAISLIEDELRWLLDLASPRAPFITSQPQNQSVTVDGSASFFVGAGGSFPLYYQWLVDATMPVAGAVDPSLTLLSVQRVDAGNYSVVVSNAYGSVTSSPAALTVTTDLPVPTTLLFVDFPLTSPYEPALVARGYPYQKFTSESSLNSAIAAADPETTVVVVDGINGFYTFSSLPGFVSQGGRAILQYWDLTSGSSLATAFRVSAGQALTTPVPVYDWGGSTFFEGLSSPLMFADFFNRDGLRLQPMAGGQAVAGFGSSTPVANQAALVIGNSGRTIVHGMWLEVVSSFNDAVRLAQNQLDFLIAPLPPTAPFVTRQQVDSRAVQGHTARLAVNAGGSLPLSYQWRKGGVEIIGATSTDYLIMNAQVEDSGRYDVVVNNAHGTVTSSAANLVVSAIGPVADAVLFRDGPNASPYAAGLANLGIPFQQVANDAAFNVALAAADPARTLVVVDATWNYHYLSALEHFVQAGGRAILQDWTLSAGKGLASLFEVTVGQPFFTPRPVYDWNRSPLFNDLSSPISFTKRFNLSGRPLEAAGGALAVAGYTSSPGVNQAAIVVGNAGRTIVNAVVLEEITAFANAVRLTENEIELLSALRTLRLLAPSWVGGQFQVSIEGTAGLTYSLRGSSNFVHWTTLTNVTLSSSPTIISIPAPADWSFYQALTPPVP